SCSPAGGGPEGAALQGAGQGHAAVHLPPVQRPLCRARAPAAGRAPRRAGVASELDHRRARQRRRRRRHLQTAAGLAAGWRAALLHGRVPGHA
nr:hypothetical protein [Tanacetum cinerariifolium]